MWAQHFSLDALTLMYLRKITTVTKWIPYTVLMKMVSTWLPDSPQYIHTGCRVCLCVSHAPTRPPNPSAPTPTTKVAACSSPLVPGILGKGGLSHRFRYFTVHPFSASLILTECLHRSCRRNCDGRGEAVVNPLMGLWGKESSDSSWDELIPLLMSGM